MIYLVLSILSSSLIFVVFKAFSRFRIQNYPAIIANYYTAFAVGILSFPRSLEISEFPKQPWFVPALCLGLIFVVIFNLMARTSQLLGVSVASVATKMSLVLPVLAGIFLYNEHLGPVRITGILLALLAVYWASLPSSNSRFTASQWILPLLVFLGSGLIDLCIKYMQTHYVPDNEFPLFSATVFASAGTLGILGVFLKKNTSFSMFTPRNLLGGVVLGIPNFFSIFFLLKALGVPGLSSAAIFTLNNVAIVLLSTLLGVVIFREKLSQRNWFGVGLAVVSIIMVGLGA